MENNNQKVAWVYPGQGSQSVGMANAVLEVGQEKLAQSAEILGWSVVEVCNGPIDILSQTQFTQPCLYTISAILTDRLKAEGKVPHLLAGHSLGEYSALYGAGVWDFATGLELVKQRSLLMAQDCGGKMVALIGFDRPQLESVIAQEPEVVIANDNSPEQVVISGPEEKVDQVIGQIRVKRAIPLPVSGAFHSPLMESAQAKLADLIAQAPWRSAQIPVLLNSDPQQPVTSALTLCDRLQRQITAPVRWREISLYLAQQGFSQVIEVGPGKVLTGLIKRTTPSIELVNLLSQ